jgi:hypothetical protein
MDKLISAFDKLGTSKPEFAPLVANLIKAARNAQILGDKVDRTDALMRLLQGSATKADRILLQIAQTDVSSNIARGADQATRLADELKRAVGNMISLSAQGVSSLRESELRLQNRDDPVALAGALANEKFGDVSGFDPILRGELIKQRDAFIENSKATEMNRQELIAWQKAQTEVSGGTGAATSRIEEFAKATKAAAEETAGFMKGLVSGAIGDFKSALDDGKITIKEWGNIFLNVLDKITDRLLNQVLDALFEVNDAGQVGGGGGSLIGRLVGAFMNAKGNAFDNGSVVKKFASGGVVSSTTSFGMTGGQTGIMGEAGPEGILPLTRTRGGDLGVKQVGGGGDGVVVQIVDQRGADAPPVRQERSQTGDGRELRRFIIGAIKEATASGELDSVQGGRFGARPVKVLR